MTDIALIASFVSIAALILAMLQIRRARRDLRLAISILNQKSRAITRFRPAPYCAYRDCWVHIDIESGPYCERHREATQ